MTASLNGDVKSIPVRCLIEVKNGSTSCADAGVSPPETETFAIVPSNSLFKDVVKTVLIKLGYSIYEATSAKGAVQIKNWRALDLEQVTDDELVSVEDVLGDLANVATLRIRIMRKSRSDDVKDKMLLLLLQQSFELLLSKGCPITKDDLERVAEGRGELSIASQTEFYMWYNKRSTISPDETLTNALERHIANTTHSQPLMPAHKTTRIRISFSPEEVAKLQSWFEQDPHPSRTTMTRYLTELNELHTRGTGLKSLDITNVMYWFKNSRAAARKSGRSITSEDLSEDESHCERDGSATTLSIPTLPNSNAVYSIKDPILMVKDETKGSNDQAPLDVDDMVEESDMDEDLSVTDDESENNEGEIGHSVDKSMIVDNTGEESECAKPDNLTTSCSSPKSNTNLVNSVAHRLPGYPFPYGAFPMAYLQSQIHPFYKDWNDKVQSAVAQANAANTAQQNMALLKSESMKSECELSKAERQKRHRAFIDPVSEIPKLEQWFTKDTHPSHFIIEQICDDLNRGEFRSRYPKLSPKNIQLWFKNHRAKVKRMRVGGGSLNFNGMEASQIKSSSSPRGGLSMSMLEGV